MTSSSEVPVGPGEEEDVTIEFTSTRKVALFLKDYNKDFVICTGLWPFSFVAVLVIFYRTDDLTRKQAWMKKSTEKLRDGGMARIAITGRSTLARGTSSLSQSRRENTK